MKMDYRKTLLQKYLFGFPIFIFVLIASYYAERGIDSVVDLPAFETGKPSGIIWVTMVALKVFNSLIIVFLSLLATDKILQASRVAHFWLQTYVYWGFLVIVVSYPIYSHIPDWVYLLDLTDVIAVELFRRLLRGQFRLDHTECADAGVSTS